MMHAPGPQPPPHPELCVDIHWLAAQSWSDSFRNWKQRTARGIYNIVVSARPSRKKLRTPKPDKRKPYEKLNKAWGVR